WSSDVCSSDLVLRHDRLDCSDYPAAEQSVVLSVFIVSFIGEWGLELMDQIAVGPVYLNHVKPCLDCTHRTPFIRIDHFIDFIGGKRMGCFEFITECNRRT